MEKARGDYIAFLDSDDEWWPTKLEKQVALMDSLSDEWGCSYTGAYVNKVGGLTRNRVYKPFKSGYLLKDLLMNKLVNETGLMMMNFLKDTLANTADGRIDNPGVKQGFNLL